MSTRKNLVACLLALVLGSMLSAQNMTTVPGFGYTVEVELRTKIVTDKSGVKYLTLDSYMYSERDLFMNVKKKNPDGSRMDIMVDSKGNIVNRSLNEFKDYDFVDDVPVAAECPNSQLTCWIRYDNMTKGQKYRMDYYFWNPETGEKGTASLYFGVN